MIARTRADELDWQGATAMVPECTPVDVEQVVCAFSSSCLEHTHAHCFSHRNSASNSVALCLFLPLSSKLFLANSLCVPLSMSLSLCVPLSMSLSLCVLLSMSLSLWVLQMVDNTMDLAHLLNQYQAHSVQLMSHVEVSAAALLSVCV